jgi:hypothetical protein
MYMRICSKLHCTVYTRTGGFNQQELYVYVYMCSHTYPDCARMRTCTATEAAQLCTSPIECNMHVNMLHHAYVHF